MTEQQKTLRSTVKTCVKIRSFIYILQTICHYKNVSRLPKTALMRFFVLELGQNIIRDGSLYHMSTENRPQCSCSFRLKVVKESIESVDVNPQ